MSASLIEAIRKHSKPTTLPMGNRGATLSVNAVSFISEEHGTPGHIVEAEALKISIYPIRYLRNMNEIHVEEQIRLLESSIAQVGLGGLGGNLLEMLIRTGIGRIRAADGDVFEESNLNRQALSTLDNLGHPKSEAALERASQINPSIMIEAWNQFLTPQSLPAFLSECDVTIDALGGLETRLALQKACAEAGIPMVTGALAGWTGLVGVVMPGQPGPAEFMGQNNAAEETLGCPAPAVTCIASLMAMETIRILTAKPSNLEGKILIVDLKSLTFETIVL